METVPVVVLNWNGFDDTVECVESLLVQRDVRVEVHVVDNASANDEAARLEERFGGAIRVWPVAENLGFTGGNNLVLRELIERRELEWVALLNNDARADADWLASLLAGSHAPDIGLIQGPIVFDSDPELVENCGVELLTTFDTLPRLRGTRAGTWGPARDVIGVCGCAPLLRVAMLREVGLLREDFFANHEDVELSLRALRRGWRARFVPGARVHHKLSRSIARVRGREFDERSLRNQLWAVLANLPLAVLVLNLPWALLRDLAIHLAAPIVGRGALLGMLWRSRLRLWRERSTWLAVRRSHRKHKGRVPWWRIWWRQRRVWTVDPRRLLRTLRGG